MGDHPRYADWSHEKLVGRVVELEAKLREKNDKFSRLLAGDIHNRRKFVKKASKKANEFDPSRYNTRYIALKLAYLGKDYIGFEQQADNSTLPTIEGKLWDAMMKTKLIFPKTDEPYSFEGCEYSKCGRTDKGVSAFGQVIGIRVRSNEPMEIEGEERPSWDPLKDELDYPLVLNRVLPADIRVIAWCPAPSAEFSARFSCEQRQYRYFFTQPCFAPSSTTRENVNGNETPPDGWLDIEAMQEAAKLFEGLHDFRNFCKLDTARQVTNFTRRITHARIEEAESSAGMLNFVHGLQPQSQTSSKWEPKVYHFKLHGSAFLYHQVRCMVGILFLVGQGFEQPSVVSELLDVDKNDCKPKYEMADDIPLVLWDCIFPEGGDDVSKDALPWIWQGEQFGQHGEDAWSISRNMGIMWSVWRKRKMDELLAGSLLDMVAKRRIEHVEQSGVNGTTYRRRPSHASNESTRIFGGGDHYRPRGRYIPMLARDRLELPEVQNARWRARKAAKQPQENGDVDE